MNELIALFEGPKSAPRSALLALLVLAAGCGLAYLARYAAARLVKNVRRWLPQAADQEDDSADVIVSRGVFWFVVVLALMMATEVLGFPVLSTWLGTIAAYLPRVIAALLIVFTGVLLGSFARGTLAHALPISEVFDRFRLAQALNMAIVGISVLVAVQQLSIDVGFIMNILTITFAGLLTAVVLAFGLGSRNTMSNILAGHYVRELYAVGQKIRIGDTEGRIIRITATSVLLETGDGETSIPTVRFMNEPSTRITVRKQGAE
jgi:small-conductance mechanosensitive channel